jgi:hypothetical protein
VTFWRPAQSAASWLTDANQLTLEAARLRQGVKKGMAAAHGALSCINSSALPQRYLSSRPLGGRAANIGIPMQTTVEIEVDERP